MSIRQMTVQYTGDTLYLPPLEREVNHIIVYNNGLNGFEHFEPRQTNSSEWYWFNICKRIKREQIEDRRVRLWNGEYFVPERTCEEFGSVRVWQECNVWSHELSCGHEVDTLDMEPPNYCPHCGARVTPKNSETTPKVVEL